MSLPQIATTELIVFCGDGVDASEHRHHALQAVWSFEEETQLRVGDQEVRAEALLIAADAPHSLRAPERHHGVVLINPESLLGRRLTSALTGRQVMRLSRPSSRGGDSAAVTLAWLRAWFAEVTRGVVPASLDPRVEEAITHIEQLAEKRISARELAARVVLSEGRFAHLFKDEVGVPLRRYLMWVRTLDAISLAREGRTLTEAAHAAGFSDSAHFTRTFRRCFGVSPKRALSMIHGT